MSYLETLNERQKEAVLMTEGPVCVLAGAGSGKTKVLTARMYHLMKGGVAPHNILAVTFTNKAAREMRERLLAMLSIPSDQYSEYRGAYKDSIPFISTFHGLGRFILEQYGSHIGIPRHFQIYDREDSERTVKNALKEMGIDPKEVAPRLILNRISKAKNDGHTVHTFSGGNEHGSFHTRVVKQVWEKYNEQLTKDKSVDFDDLLVLPVSLLKKNEEVRLALTNRFTYIHIDEYQDTNTIQEALVTLLSGEKKNVFVVGDCDQLVYNWRGAVMENILEFEKRYDNAKHIVLEQNYRSTQTIVNASNEVIEKNKNRKERVSKTSNPVGEPITIHIAHTGDSEARWIAQTIEQQMQDGVSAKEIAVLYRTNFQSRALEEALLDRGIPYRLIGTRFYDRKEVKDVLSWVRLALDPSRENDKMRAVQSPPRGIGKVTLGKLLAGKTEELRASDKLKIASFDKILEDLNECAQTQKASEFIKTVIEKSTMKDALVKEGDEGLERLGNIEELATLASRYDQVPGLDGISAFLADVSLAQDQDALDHPDKSKQESAEAVSLMTVHAAKGLEFEVVFVSGMEAGLFPHEGMGGEDDATRDDEEERRLFYVAMTRAKKKLYLTLARVRRIYGTDYLQDVSEFVSDINVRHTEFSEADSLPSIF
jgi:DNA helicase-2/ATP-dependent DNA helicase PcrA